MMNSTSTMSPSLSKSPLLSSSVINPCHLGPRLLVSVNYLGRRHSYCISMLRCFADDSATGNTSSSSSATAIFGGKREMSVIQSLAEGLSPSVRIASSVLVVAGALAAGYGLGSQFGGSKNAAVGAAVTFGAAA